MEASTTATSQHMTFGAALTSAADLAGRMAVLGWGSLLAGSMQLLHADLVALLRTLPMAAWDTAVRRDHGYAVALADLPGDRPIHDGLPALRAALSIAFDDVTAGRVPLPASHATAAALRSALDRVGTEHQLWLHI